MVEKQVMDVANAMPADKYNFTPESLHIAGANFTGVYTFAGIVKHLATVNYMLWAGAAGEAAPTNLNGEKGPDSLTSKADIVKFLGDSFALGHKAVKALTAENSLEMVAGFGGNKMPRLFTTTFPVVHANDEYGQMVEYLRLNGIVPPASMPKSK
jgi:hypothetical protein